jgi:hypothetical protein
MAKLSKTILPLLVKLKDKGVTRINVDFSGSGDSGDIDDVYLLVNGEQLAWGINEKRKYISDEQEDQLKNEMYEFIDSAIEGKDWVNNEGGYGNVTIYLDSMTADVEYSQRTVEEYSWQDLSLFDI